MGRDSNLVGKNTKRKSDFEIIVHDESKDNDASTSKTNQNFIISNGDLLHNFIKTTLELREIVKCPLW